MLYFLKNSVTGNILYLLNAKYEVGRKSCDLLIENDQSISRKHAVIEVNDDCVKITDLGSRYKTCVNGSEITPNVSYQLANNDEIKFGVYNSKFRLEQFKFITTSTRLNNAEKKQLKKDLIFVKGDFVDDWTPECTHLTVNDITLTVKLLHALIDKKPIVTPGYWAEIKRCVLAKQDLPDITDFSNPPVNETLISRVAWKRDVHRENMFQNKLFIFTTENTRASMKDVINKLGGSSISWEKNPMTLTNIKESSEQVILIQPNEKVTSKSFQEVMKFMKMKGKRLIPQQEIALAVVSGNCDKDCNPDFNRIEEVFGGRNKEVPKENNILVANTESQYESQDICKVKEDSTVIPDSCEAVNNEPEKQHKDSSSTDMSNENNTVGERCTFKRPADKVSKHPPKRLKTEEKESTGSTFVKNHSSQPDEKLVDSTWQVKEESNDKESSKKENSGAENPFSKMLKRTRRTDPEKEETENPFKRLRRKVNEVEETANDNSVVLNESKRSQTDIFPSEGSNSLLEQPTSDKPFEGLRKKANIDVEVIPEDEKRGLKENTRSQRNIFHSTANSSRLEDSTYNISRVIKNENVTWYSKKSLTDVPVQPQKQPASAIETALKDFVEQFKDKVVVESMVVPERIVRNPFDKTDGGRQNGRKNFKKFRKVQPLHPQKNCVNMIEPVVVGTNANMSHITIEEEDVGFEDLKPLKKKPKRFMFRE